MKYENIPINDQVATQTLHATRSTITQGELLTLLGAVKHAFPDARIFSNPINGGDHA